MFGAIRNRNGEKIDYAHQPGNPDSRDIVLIGHGVTGHKDRPVPIALAEGLSRAGIASLRFSFSGNGQSEGRFEEATLRKEVDDLGAVIDSCAGLRVAYAGHSMGAAVGVLRARQDSRIRLLVSLAGMVYTREFAERMFGHLKPGELMWDKPGCPLSTAYLDCMREVDSVVDQAAGITIPWLFVHGTLDETVAPRDTDAAYERASGPKHREIIERADHLFEPGFGARMSEIVATWCAAGFSRL